MVFAGIVFVLFIVLTVIVAFGSKNVQQASVACGILSLLAVPAIPHGRVMRTTAISQIFVFASCAFVAAYLTKERDWLPMLTLFVCLVLSAVLAVAFALAERRTSPWIFAAVASIALVSLWLGLRFGGYAAHPWLTNVPVMESFGMEFRGSNVFVPAVWISVVLLSWLVSNFFDSSLGRGIVVADLNPALARSFGIHRTAHRFSYHGLAALGAALAGWFYAYWSREISIAIISPVLVFAVLISISAGLFLGSWGAVLTAFGLALLTLDGISPPGLGANSAAQIAFAALCAVTLGTLWKFYPQIAGLFRRVRRLIDPHSVDMGMIDERSGMKGQGAPPPGKELLHLEKVVLTSNVGVKILDGVDLSVFAGEIVGVLADRAETRRALLALMSGQVSPSSGELFVWSESANRIAPHDWVRHGMARTHNPSRMIEDFPIIDNVTIGASARVDMSVASTLVRLNGFLDRTLRSEAMSHLARFWMREEASAFPKDLSESRLQLVELARALTADPALVILDHPGSALNPTDRETMVTVVKDLLDIGLSVIVVDHDLGFIRDVAKKIVLIEQGRVIAEGSTERVLARDGLRARVEQFER